MVLDSLGVVTLVINPHQRCGYSDLPFARTHYFHTAGSGNRLEGSEAVCPQRLTLRKNHVFVVEKTCWGHRTEWKRRPGSAGSDNEAHWSCKRWVTAKVVQNWQLWIQNQENEGFNFLDSGNPKFSRRRPTQPSRLVGFKQETTPQTGINPKNAALNPKNAAFKRLQALLPQNPGLIQKLKVPKWVCRSTLASFCHGQPFRAIFGPARGQIYGKWPKNKKNMVLVPFCGWIPSSPYGQPSTF